MERARSLDMTTLRFATAFRLLKIRQAFLEGQSIDEVYNITRIDPWFLYQIKELVNLNGSSTLQQLKTNGLSDEQIEH